MSTAEITKLDPAEIRVAAFKVDPAEVVAGYIENVGASHKLSILELPKVVVPAAPRSGSPLFNIQTADGDQAVPTIEGVAIFITDARAFYENEYGEGQSGPPTCASSDGITGIGKPGGECATCSLNQFVEDDKGNRRKPCGEMKHMLLLMEGNLLPVLVQVPATSLRAYGQFGLALAGQGLRYWQVVLSMSLDMDKSSTGKPYCKLKFKSARRLTEAEIKAAQSYNGLMQKLIGA